jgi:hypothetical protein
LARRISPYSGTDPLFLGLFSDAGRANNAREAYLASVSSADPWRQQAYRNVSLEEDLVTIEVPDRRTDVSRGVVFLVTSYFEAMGQSCRCFEAVFSDRKSADTYAREREAGPVETAPNFCDIDEVVLNAPR